MKYFLLLIAGFILSINTYCSDPVIVNFCNNTTSTINITDFLNCNEVVVNDASWTVKSFTISYKMNGNIIEENIIGNTIPSNFQNGVQTNSPNQLFIENVILVDANNVEKPLKSTAFKLVN